MRTIKKRFGVKYSVKRNKRIKSGKFKYGVVAKRPDGISWVVADSPTKLKAQQVAKRFKKKGK